MKDTMQPDEEGQLRSHDGLRTQTEARQGGTSEERKGKLTGKKGEVNCF